LATFGPLAMLVMASACRGDDAAGDAAPAQDAPLVSVTGLSGPEAVRYDPDLDVYFVANFNGAPAGDANGFVSRVLPDGTVDSLRFMQGTESAPLHGARGMYITGDTLWVADANGVHGFSRQTGQQLAFIDMTAFSPGFLNDITRGPDGALYLTDTDGRRVFRVAGGAATIALDAAPVAPNGITWDAGAGRFLLASWSEESGWLADITPPGSTSMPSLPPLVESATGNRAPTPSQEYTAFPSFQEARRNRPAPASHVIPLGATGAASSAMVAAPPARRKTRRPSVSVT
jgi:hypothetical protein